MSVFPAVKGESVRVVLLHLNKETTRSGLETDALDSNKTTDIIQPRVFNEKHPQRTTFSHET